MCQDAPKDIAIYGAGGLGRETACLIDKINRYTDAEPRWRLIGFFDDGVAPGTMVHGVPVLGGLSVANSWAKPLDMVLAIGSPRILQKLSAALSNPNLSFPNIIHPEFPYYLSDPDSFRLGKGNIIQGLCVATTNVHIGDFNVLNGSVVLGHDVHVGCCNVFMNHNNISGEVRIGDGNLFGSGCFVRQGLHVDTGVKVGAGAYLLTRPKNNSTYLGNPAKIFKF